MIANKERNASVTSSKSHVLMAKGKGLHGFSVPALTYIEERKIERKLGRSCSTDNPNKTMLWGLFMEMRVYELIGGEEFSGYRKESTTSIVHPKYKHWAGSPDLVGDDKIGDIKCYQPKNFALFTDMLMQKDVALFKDEFPEEYWQLISNAAISGVKKAEAISYMPYESELDKIKEMADYLEGEDQWKYKFISDAISYNRDSIAYLPDGGYYKNLNRFEFIVPPGDIKLLEERVKLALSMIYEDEPSVIIAHHDKEVNATIIEPSNLTPKNNLTL